MFLFLLKMLFYIDILNISRSSVDIIYAFKIMETKIEEG